MEVYDPLTDRWREVAPLPAARGGLAAALFQVVLVAAGGEILSGRQTLSDIHFYNREADVWLAGPSLPAGIHGFVMAAWEQGLWLVGGSDQAAGALNQGRVLVYQP